MAILLPALQSKFEQGQLLRHTDGGYYQYEKSVYSTVDQSELIIYKHIWPFQESEWARPYNEFKDKFTPITFEDLYAAKQVAREDLQKQIEENKANRRKGEAEAKEASRLKDSLQRQLESNM